jgi:hypothetical protein
MATAARSRPAVSSPGRVSGRSTQPPTVQASQAPYPGQNLLEYTWAGRLAWVTLRQYWKLFSALALFWLLTWSLAGFIVLVVALGADPFLVMPIAAPLTFWSLVMTVPAVFPFLAWSFYVVSAGDDGQPVINETQWWKRLRRHFRASDFSQTENGSRKLWVFDTGASYVPLLPHLTNPATTRAAALVPEADLMELKSYYEDGVIYARKKGRSLAELFRYGIGLAIILVEVLAIYLLSSRLLDAGGQS